ncbi:MAG: hypothetical protein HYY52_02085 [Candidatus Melainabacteria bacterium]|nr:hypothetical protein [Candidatus Melainabacteria bacterium]
MTNSILHKGKLSRGSNNDATRDARAILLYLLRVFHRLKMSDLCEYFNLTGQGVRDNIRCIKEKARTDDPLRKTFIQILREV